MEHVFPIERLAGNIEILLLSALYIKHLPQGRAPGKQKNKEDLSLTHAYLCRTLDSPDRPRLLVPMLLMLTSVYLSGILAFLSLDN